MEEIRRIRREQWLRQQQEQTGTVVKQEKQEQQQQPSTQTGSRSSSFGGASIHETTAYQESLSDTIKSSTASDATKKKAAADFFKSMGFPVDESSVSGCVLGGGANSNAPPTTFGNLPGSGGNSRIHSNGRRGGFS